MPTKHVLKLTESEAVVKCYITDPSGGTVDISLQNDLTKSTQEYVNDGTCKVGIKAIYWGLKAGKQLDLTRITDPIAGTVHGHYYLVNAGSYNFNAFHDHVYEEKDLRLIFDGPGHCIVELRKDGWKPKVENEQFGSYDNPAVVGS
jgi:hypothetical protein